MTSPIVAAREHLEDRPDDRRLFLVDGECRRGRRSLLHVVVAIDAVAVAAHLSHAQPVEPPARGALDDLCSLELGKRAQHGQRQLVLGVLLVVLAVDRDLLAVLEKFADDDPLVFNFASDAVGSEKIDPVEPIGFQIGPHPIEGRSIEQRAGVPVVNVLLDEHVACGSDLSFQLHKLAFNCSFLLLRVGAHAGVQCGFRHTW